jgi:serine/threonine-protein kinase RsbW
MTLKSDPRNVAKVESYLENIVDRFGLCSEVYGNILISLTEAVTNAITHGNKNNTNKYVNVRCLKTERKLCFQVSDQGEGFDPQNIPDPTRPENLLSLNGRGVFLMRQLCDEVEYTDDGRTVEMNFMISPSI